jgi:hypothetical protein
LPAMILNFPCSQGLYPTRGRSGPCAGVTLLHHLLPVRLPIPRTWQADVLLCPCCVSWKYAARSRAGFFLPCGFGLSRISKSIAPLELGCCNDH